MGINPPVRVRARRPRLDETPDAHCHECGEPLYLYDCKYWERGDDETYGLKKHRCRKDDD